MGVGGEFPAEFEACGVPVDERGARTDEALEILTRLWTGDRVSYDGRFTRFRDIAIQPVPTQRPRPPMWVSGRSEAAMRRAARHAEAWMPYLFTPDMVAESTAKVRAMAARPVLSALLAFFCVHSDRSTARAMAIEALSRQYRQDFSGLVDRYALAGTPDEVITQARRFTDAGVRTMMVASACPSGHVDENLPSVCSRGAAGPAPGVTTLALALTAAGAEVPGTVRSTRPLRALPGSRNAARSGRFRVGETLTQTCAGLKMRGRNHRHWTSRPQRSSVLPSMVMPKRSI